MRNEEIATRYTGVEVEPFVLSGIATDFHRPFLSRRASRSFVSNVFPTMAPLSLSLSLSLSLDVAEGSTG